MSVEQSSGTPTPVYTLFESKTIEEPTVRDLASLAAGTIAAIRVPGFFPVETCGEIMEALQVVELGSYDEQVVVPRIAKLGPAVYDYYIDRGIAEQYWEHGRQSDRARTKVMGGGDPLDLAMEKVGAIFGAHVARATIGGRPLFAGMIREINRGARIHFDEVERELPGGLDDTPVAQIAFNCHLSMPQSGGEATIFRRRWVPSDEERRDGYGYQYSLVAKEPSVSVRAEAGDAVFFDSRNYHRVEPNKSSGRRVTLSFFIGLTARGEVRIWS